MWRLSKCVVEKNKDSVKALMKTKTERFPNFEKEYNEYLLMVQKEQNAEILAEKMAQEEEEKEGVAKAKAAKKEWDDQNEYGDEDGKTYAGGNNQYLDDDFM